MTKPFAGLLEKQYTELGVNFRTVWDYYLKFYIAFMALNFTALGLLIQYIDRDKRLWIVVSFGVQNILSAISALAVGAYGRRVAHQQQAIINACRERPEDGASSTPDELPFQTPVPAKLASWGASANAVSQLLFLLCWIAAAVLVPSPEHKSSAVSNNSVAPIKAEAQKTALPGNSK